MNKKELNSFYLLLKKHKPMSVDSIIDEQLKFATEVLGKDFGQGLFEPFGMILAFKPGNGRLEFFKNNLDYYTKFLNKTRSKKKDYKAIRKLESQLNEKSLSQFESIDKIFGNNPKDFVPNQKDYVFFMPNSNSFFASTYFPNISRCLEPLDHIQKQRDTVIKIIEKNKGVRSNTVRHHICSLVNSYSVWVSFADFTAILQH